MGRLVTASLIWIAFPLFRLVVVTHHEGLVAKGLYQIERLTAEVWLTHPSTRALRDKAAQRP